MFLCIYIYIYICVCVCVCVCTFFSLFFHSNDDKITFISLYNVLCHVCICLPLTLIGYSCAVNKILFYSILLPPLYLKYVLLFTKYYKYPGLSCSKLTMSLVNDSLKFTSSDTQIC